MKRRKFLNTIGGASGMLLSGPLLAVNVKDKEFLSAEATSEIPGVWKFTFGKPEKITPQSTRTIKPQLDVLKKLPAVVRCPVDVTCAITDRGVFVKLPMQKDESVYGLGLQFQSFQQRGLKKMLRVNADPIMDTGDSHAPVPFFVTTSGYGVLIDTARYATFYMGNKRRKPQMPAKSNKTKYNDEGLDATNGVYEQHNSENGSEILIDIPRTEGIDVYVFAGPSVLQAVQRYNLFAGGGVLPPRWGLGFWYRVQSDFNQNEVKVMADYFRKSRIPCDVLGLEPHWQSHAYSCSYLWSDLFPNPAKMVNDLKGDHFRVNLWEHAFVHPSSPIYNDLLSYSGDYEVWGGLVPDFISDEGAKIFGDFHRKEHIDLGVSGYKADECDNSDYTGNWSFPEVSRFPSGADGEQMHSMFGLKYQDAIVNAFKQKEERTYGLVRSSGALAAPYPFVIYSDLYDHKTFIHGVAQSGFSGLLWTPEVRHATSNEDLIRRLQTVVFSPLAMVNAWYLKNAPWKQIERDANNAGRFADDWEQVEAKCRDIIELRMKLVPYIHTAFVRYQQQGIPPFRALVMDFPNDKRLRDISDQFLVGENMLVAPVVAGVENRKVYLPEGDWYELWTSKKYAGKNEYAITAPLDQIPVFIKAGTILPFAKVTQHTDDPESWKLTAKVFGEVIKPFIMYEDKGGLTPDLIEIELNWDNQKKTGSLSRKSNPHERQYTVTEWTHID